MMKILIVDDSKTILKTAKLILQDKYDVYMANSGEMSLDILKKKEINLVLMDVDMPGMNGIDTVKEIRKNPDLKDIPVIFFTALATKEVINECIEVGMDGYIVKPYKADQLIEKIKAVINE